VEYRDARRRAFLREVVPAVLSYTERFREAGAAPEDIGAGRPPVTSVHGRCLCSRMCGRKP
jgi:hypothetical protein